MTVVLTDRIEMADNDDFSLDDLFDQLEPVPEGYRVEVVRGVVHMSPQRTTHWDIIRRVLRQLENHFGEDARITSDVRIDFPGYRNGFCPDLAKLADDATPDRKGKFSPYDVELIVEVISKGTAINDYGDKKETYAETGVPVYVIVDPYRAQCHVFASPKGNTYRSEVTVDFGDPIDLTRTPLGLTIRTDKFPRD
ncbi:Uma2 family endonuclease [Streptomyces huiliensis]|uniref:Uma2 family endonuclease n=1 Tax=Streptomyces huiliensis TaxID=2876027 RepID=UPI001CC1073D|nr:Uma2 family endonuclease [Streptomyces huiliensis]MBZ4321742.1 Uma2 family endonuclease [Streptomyces huiliensis]